MYRPKVVLEMSNEAKGRGVIECGDYGTRGKEQNPEECGIESMLPPFKEGQ